MSNITSPFEIGHFIENSQDRERARPLGLDADVVHLLHATRDGERALHEVAATAHNGVLFKIDRLEARRRNTARHGENHRCCGRVLGKLRADRLSPTAVWPISALSVSNLN